MEGKKTHLSTVVFLRAGLSVWDSCRIRLRRKRGGGRHGGGVYIYQFHVRFPARGINDPYAAISCHVNIADGKENFYLLLFFLMFDVEVERQWKQRETRKLCKK